MVYDHHCPWINNCVGKDNHIFFVSYVMSLLALTAFQIFLNVTILIDHDLEAHDAYAHVICGIVLMIALIFLVPLR
jgi:palmitoyltransferase